MCEHERSEWSTKRRELSFQNAVPERAIQCGRHRLPGSARNGAALLCSFHIRSFATLVAPHGERSPIHMLNKGAHTYAIKGGDTHV